MTSIRRPSLSPELGAGILLGLLAALWTAARLGVGPEPLAWLLTRASGVAGYLLLTTSVASGALMRSRIAPRWLIKASQYGWHGQLAGFGLAAIGAHLAFTLVDAMYPQTLAGVLIPGLASYAPAALAMGTLAVYLTALVYLSFARKRRLPGRVWRWAHLASYPAFALATAHGILAGSDELVWLYLPALAIVAAVTGLRFVEDRRLPT